MNDRLPSSQLEMGEISEREEILKEIKQEPIDIKPESEFTLEENEFCTKEEYINEGTIRELKQEPIDIKVKSESSLEEDYFYKNQKWELSISQNISDIKIERNTIGGDVFVGIDKVEVINTPIISTKPSETSGKTLMQCNYCEKMFPSKSKLNRHSRIHTREKPYLCNFCGKNFSRKDHLIAHERIHTGVKPYKCNICEKMFRYKSNFKSHKKIHTGEKPHECNICKKNFSEKHHLIYHERIHTGEKPYECNICKKNFNRKSTLIVHERIHTREKPCKCNICKNFGQKTCVTTQIWMFYYNKDSHLYV